MADGTWTELTDREWIAVCAIAAARMGPRDGTAETIDVFVEATERWLEVVAMLRFEQQPRTIDTPGAAVAGPPRYEVEISREHGIRYRTPQLPKGRLH
jgi:hypothetical protein